MNIKVCDMIMGSGKIESAITLINQDASSRYIFITPYLDEIKRIKQSCKARSFKDPKNKGEGKLDDLHDLLSAGRNIASTHALFERYNEKTISLIQDRDYKLILDEVFQVVRTINISSKDLKMLRTPTASEDPNEEPKPCIEVEPNGRVRWVKADYQGKFEDLRDMCLTGNVILYKDCLMLWKFPMEVFEAFHEVIILTYLFDAQIQKYYFDMHGIAVQKIGTVWENGVYQFSESVVMPEYVKALPRLIHILDDQKLNDIGDGYTNLSSSWYDRARKAKGQPLIKQMRNNLTNVFINNLNPWSSTDILREGTHRSELIFEATRSIPNLAYGQHKKAAKAA